MGWGGVGGGVGCVGCVGVVVGVCGGWWWWWWWWWVLGGGVLLCGNGEPNSMLRPSFLLEASFGFRVLSSPASVCVCVSVCQSVRQSLACPHDNSGPVQARIAKFGPKVYKTLIKISVVFDGD